MLHVLSRFYVEQRSPEAMWYDENRINDASFHTLMNVPQ